MEFEFSAAQEEFRRELRSFLDGRLTDEWRGVFGSNSLENIPLTRSICQALGERGWLTMSWPREYGGNESDLWSQMVLREEMFGRGEPRGPQYMNLNYIGPMIMKFGTAEQKERFLPPMAAGDVIWTQGFSEPDAGSDLASLSTRAQVHDDHFVVNGQKIWNSYAGSPADWCLLLVRTDPEAPKHKGISVLLVDMATSGVTVRPIESMAGIGEINEIFFDNAVVPRDCLLGPLHGGWPVIVAGLALERTGIALHSRAGNVIAKLADYAKNTERNGRPLSADPGVRRKIADLYIRYRAARLVSYRVTSMIEGGRDPVAEASMAWIHGSTLLQDVGRVGLAILGERGQLIEGDPDAPLAGAVEREWVEMLPMTIAAGTLDVQKLIVAQRGLGLPKAG